MQRITLLFIQSLAAQNALTTITLRSMYHYVLFTIYTAENEYHISVEVALVRVKNNQTLLPYYSSFLSL